MRCARGAGLPGLTRLGLRSARRGATRGRRCSAHTQALRENATERVRARQDRIARSRIGAEPPKPRQMSTDANRYPCPSSTRAPCAGHMAPVGVGAAKAKAKRNVKATE